MICIGIISEKKFFNNVKEEVYLKNAENDIEILKVDYKKINMEKIKYEMIIIEENILINISDEEIKEIIDELNKYTKFILLNIDNNISYMLKHPKVITYGLNTQADITVSSITETNILIYWQKNIRIREKELTEIEEIKVTSNSLHRLKIYEIISIFNVFRLGKCIKIAEI